MKKYGILILLLFSVTVWDLSKNNFPKFGQKVTKTEAPKCQYMCEKIQNCLSEDQKKLQDPKLVQFACEILCTKQYQLFDGCSQSILTSCQSGEICIKNLTKGLF
ncbi:hypothetical protein EHQ92_14325 [Leptospira biflexa]|jgi:hypothetical protein|uniref:Cys-rich protein n=1 Tax=Leptospira biflexa serovar Patoc (strain Patoc 1 / ATCC 23582 / Paris) TaxID=456481 RepID=B0STD5_LEPBP|nr:hypothetical protein [Leptospira biflexa]ABZ94709.1 Hypothetical protein LBF_3365 [Leptospira biflexa serovar Patoc strain 'Patoc 1 (Ames)']ABZ98375.1 Hypothetical protein LEPBI_I2280 [Leptospira biflexa serovar Patoc strain 'Patoc 1 (Paris)']TGM44119.1 hypothetical protein EHQ92_14325 [Leptospira biflexa]TGM45097.1 hypothetical protein EHQ88_16425 [Leptospira biflexa]